MSLEAKELNLPNINAVFGYIELKHKNFKSWNRALEI
jgi:hypothetical protein